MISRIHVTLGNRTMARSEASDTHELDLALPLVECGWLRSCTYPIPRSLELGLYCLPVYSCARFESLLSPRLPSAERRYDTVFGLLNKRLPLSFRFPLRRRLQVVQPPSPHLATIGTARYLTRRTTAVYRSFRTLRPSSIYHRSIETFPHASAGTTPSLQGRR